MRMRIFSIVFTCIFLAAGYAYGVEKDKEIKKYSVTKDDITVTAYFDKPVYTKEDKEINLNIIVKNISKSEICLILINPMFDFSWQITDTDGNIAPMTELAEKMKNGKSFSAFIAKLAFGEEYKNPKINLKEYFVLNSNQTYNIQFEGQASAVDDEKTVKKYKLTDIALEIK